MSAEPKISPSKEQILRFGNEELNNEPASTGIAESESEAAIRTMERQERELDAILAKQKEFRAEREKQKIFNEEMFRGLAELSARNEKTMRGLQRVIATASAYAPALPDIDFEPEAHAHFGKDVSRREKRSLSRDL